ncbi:aspartate/glutamate racemase family protein [Sphingomonas sp. 28-63-12]|uniref:aspartate/glutamate racemase family protein n=1 Tax=Sphingomonas sp. 28-63-12 TaxID=1970434 RepID=UPI000BC553F4|nr:MAG: aspartate racemase [Sphingomonas sp. 28-63-12]
MQIGLIGGIGPAATDYYYRQLIATYNAAAMPLDMTIVHADTPTLLANLRSDRRDDQAAIFAALTNRLAMAGAGCVAITSIAGHFCREAFAARSSLPVIDMISAVADAVVTQGHRRIGILGTRTVMETAFFGGIHSAEVVAPSEPLLTAVDQAYVAMAASGSITTDQRRIFETAARRLTDDDQTDAIMLGGTDLALAFTPERTPFSLIDCAAIHASAIARFAIEAR